VKKIFVISILLAGAWSCATFTPSPPPFHIEDIPQAVTIRLTLDQRIAADEAWSDLKTGRTDQAGRIIARMGPENPVYAAALGYLDFAIGDMAGAEAAFKEALRTNPDMTPAAVGLAQIYESRGESDSLFGMYREILKQDPENRWAKPRFEALKNNLAADASSKAEAALGAGDLEAARKAFLQVLFYDPASVRADLELARIYRRENDPESALLHLKAALDLKPGDKALLREYADLLYDTRNYSQSLDIYQNLQGLDPKDQDLARRIEDLKSKLGVFEVPSQYQAIPALDAITREDLAALIAVKFSGFLDKPGAQTRIMVDIGTSWAQKFIIKVASLNVMNVYDNHTFQPRKIINRAQLAEAVDRLIEVLKASGVEFVPLVDPRRIRIADVAPDNFYYQPIVRVVSYQLMDLSADRMFEPERTVPGGEAARVLDLVLRLAK